jgi:hypothetical protein
VEFYDTNSNYTQTLYLHKCRNLHSLVSVDWPARLLAWKRGYSASEIRFSSL